MKTRQWIVTVEGSGDFPVDMLRYDAAYPATENDSGRIADTGRRTVQVLMPRRPTVGRWESFCWRVLKTEEPR